ncbi:type IV secretion system protein VirB10 (plasmid) [Rhizobium sp. B230/85]|uniref:type IV secretion system protein VirB10 n=1 Tax=unclassified Rhizobium TaxID=2613769 RepID=UPI001ADCBC09|nr:MULTISPECIES: type IV secretion system protein VirB10 [unclassified Rhizobium]MBO9136613.1 type IV secretion system protein VirB10 [Rhizobium sp. B209b/85]QXZ99744.1 type IV secretion system protein VirB10 [Rhizobium sp. B230/85]
MMDVQPPHDVDSSGSIVSDPHRKRLSGSQKLLVAAAVLLISLALIWLGAYSKKKTDASSRESMIDANTKPFRPAPIDVPFKTVTPPPTQQTNDVLPAPRAQERHEVRPEETPIFAYSGGEQNSVSNASSEDEHGRDRAGADIREEEPPAENDLSIRMKPTVLQPSQAARLPHPDFLITQGNIIPCILQTAIDTNLAGYVKCVLPQDIRGATGNVVLLDRGTTVVGEIQRGLQQGDERVFVLWTRAETPGHAVITLSSPGTDELGRSGLPGKVDNHFWQRFGGAILLSLVEGAFQASTSLATHSGDGTSFNNFQNNGEQVANTALKSTINIPSTLKKNQGDTVSIFVARDLDFSSIYQLRVIGGVANARPQHLPSHRLNRK